MNRENFGPSSYGRLTPAQAGATAGSVIAVFVVSVLTLVMVGGLIATTVLWVHNIERVDSRVDRSSTVLRNLTDTIFGGNGALFGSEFPENEFAITGWPDATKRVEFDLGLVPSGADLEFQFPHQGGRLALFSEIVSAAGNTSVFFDGVFSIVNSADNSKEIMFDVSQIDPGTTRTFILPNVDAELVATEGTQTLSEKIIDSSNSIADGALSTNVIRRFTDTWTTTVMPEVEGFNRIRLVAPPITGGMDPVNRFFVFESSGSSTAGASFGMQAGAHHHLWESFSGFHISRTSSLPAPTGATSPGDPIVTITSSRLRLHRTGAQWTEFDTSELTGQHAVTIPNKSGTLAFMDDLTQLASANTSTFLDSLFTLEHVEDTTRTARFDVGRVGTNETTTYDLPRRSGPLALVDDGPAETVHNLMLDYWVPRQAPTPDTNIWSAIAYSPQLQRFAAIAILGSATNVVMYSSDGANWLYGNFTVDNQWSDMIWVAELGRFVAVAQSGTGNRVATSEDGINWETQTSAADNNWQSLVWAADLDLIVAVASTGASNRVMTSPDGMTWQGHDAAENNAWRGVTYSEERELFVAVAQSGSGNRVMTSPDGENWDAQSTPEDNWNSVAWARKLGIFVAISGTGAQVMTSPDGLRWQAHPCPSREWARIRWEDEPALFVALGGDGTSTALMTSPDGVTWTMRETPGSGAGAWFAVAWYPRLRYFVVAGDPPGGNIVLTSSYIRRGFNWGFSLRDSTQTVELPSTGSTIFALDDSNFPGTNGHHGRWEPTPVDGYYDISVRVNRGSGDPARLEVSLIADQNFGSPLARHRRQEESGSEIGFATMNMFIAANTEIEVFVHHIVGSSNIEVTLTEFSMRLIEVAD
jgi:hypothetical protein